MIRLPRRLGHGEGAALVDHLDELRTRIFVALGALAVGWAVAFAFHHRILDFLNQGLPDHLRHPVTFGVAEPFMTSLKVSFFAGLALALPVVLWQIWGFLAPAFDPKAQRAVAGFTAFASVLFVAGVVFADRLALPAALHFLVGYDRHQYHILIRARDYYSFAVMVFVAVGLVFELPIFILGLVRFGVLSSRKLRKNRRLGYFVMAVIAVALPGVDPITTAFEMAPLMLLFEGSIWLSAFFERRWHAAANPLPTT